MLCLVILSVFSAELSNIILLRILVDNLVAPKFWLLESIL
jgi:hypothetical protein